MNPSANDTIAAISTPPGEGGIGIVRLSGPRAFPIAFQLFRPPLNPADVESHRIKIGKAVQAGSGEVVDEVVLLPMRGPHSYTAEDTVEFHCHGGRMPLSLLLRETLALGARLAEPGEFTKRAFLNGRIDLTQAEAVISVIQAASEGGLKAAVKQLAGGLQEVVAEFRQDLIDLLARVEADIDFPEEQIETISARETRERTKKALDKIEGLRQTYRQGRILREGVETAIVGRPNVGKSSLLNALLNFDRAIVGPWPGTTRDVIEEAVEVRGIALRIMDTAGIRGHQDEIEAEGIRRTYKVVEGADLILAVFDGSRGLSPEDMETVEAVRGKTVIPVVNKSDLEGKLEMERLRGLFPGVSPVLVSAQSKKGLDQLEEAIYQKIWNSGMDLTENVFITRMRHEEKLRKAGEALEGVLRSLENALPPEFVAGDLHSALDWLGEITGETHTEEVLDKIFSEFCVGK